MQYIGEWDQDQMHGYGEGSEFDGDIYIGEWLNGHRTGYGRYSLSDGRVYEGQFLNGQYSGYGILKQPDGIKYRGYWKEDKLAREDEMQPESFDERITQVYERIGEIKSQKDNLVVDRFEIF